MSRLGGGVIDCFLSTLLRKKEEKKEKKRREEEERGSCSVGRSVG